VTYDCYGALQIVVLLLLLFLNPQYSIIIIIQIGYFRHLSRHISETVQDRVQVAIDH